MAFATSQQELGRNGDCYETRGKWTATSGDSAGTLTVPGARVFRASFMNNLSSGGPANDPNVSWTSSGGVITLTISPFVTVTNGSYSILSK